MNNKPALDKRKTLTPLAATIVAVGIALGVNEGMSVTPYYDSVGVLTVCEGITGPEVIKNKTYTLLECQQLKSRYLERMYSRFGQYLTVPISQEEWLAYGHFNYNLGTEHFRRNFAPLINAGKNPEACLRMMRYVYAGGRDCRVRANQCYGIVKRREFERDTCLMGVE
jgi:lysozyme